jgi:thiol-disulfide isomerase/thioredoxin
VGTPAGSASRAGDTAGDESDAVAEETDEAGAGGAAKAAGGTAKSGGGASKAAGRTAKVAGGAAKGGASKAGGATAKGAGGSQSARRASGGANSPAARRRAALAQQRRKRQTLLAVGAIVVVIVVVAVFVIVKVTGGSTTANSSTAGKSTGHASASSGVGVPVAKYVYSGFAAVKASALAAAANNAHPTDAGYPTVADDTPLTTSGKPAILYFGAEFCPFCATERWPMVLALSQFGTFKHLTSIASTPNDSTGIDSVPTFTFYKSTYTSKYLTFEPVETSTVDEKTLQSPNKAQTQIVAKYDSGQTIPFVYFNGKAILQGAEYDPNLLRKGSFDDDAKSIIGGTSSLATSVYFNAGAIVSDICAMTGGKPGNVCKAFPKPITS